MAFTERYKIFLSIGGGKIIDYIFFISDMKKAYNESIGKHKDFPIYNHDEFTKFIRKTATTGRRCRP